MQQAARQFGIAAVAADDGAVVAAAVQQGDHTTTDQQRAWPLMHALAALAGVHTGLQTSSICAHTQCLRFLVHHLRVHAQRGGGDRGLAVARPGLGVGGLPIIT